MPSLARIAQLPRRAWSATNRQLLFARFRRTVRMSAPVPVAREGGVRVSGLTGHRDVLMFIGACKSLFRFHPPGFRLAVHEDGTLTAADRALLHHHLPGVEIVDRAVADAKVEGLLAAAGYEHCLALRRRLPFALKLFDLRVFAPEDAKLYFDSDVLFLRPPEELVAAMTVAPEAWADRYAIDVGPAYCWTPEQVMAATGIELQQRINAGLLAIRRPDWAPDFALFEHCLATLPISPDRLWYAEQTLNAIDLSRHGARPLSGQYDVCFAHSHRGHYDTWLRTAIGGEDVTAQHYCGGWAQRKFYYRHFLSYVAPQLRYR